MDPGERRQVAIIRRLIRCVLEGHGDSTNDDGQYLACCCQWDRQGNTRTDALMTGNNQNG